jgi:hypothetical protein
MRAKVPDVNPDDFRIAEGLSAQIVAASTGRVCRVVMIGSRAVGTARPDSDLDLVVVIEPPGGADRWGDRARSAERLRLHQMAASAPLPADIGVRTADQYQEAHGVVGGPEHLAATHGIPVYSRAPERAPVVRRTPDQVRYDNASIWIRHALVAVDHAVGAENMSVLAAAGPKVKRDPRALAQAAVERALNAILVLRRVHVDKHIGIGGMLARIAEVEPGTASALRHLLVNGHHSAQTAHTVGRAVLQRLVKQPEMAARLADVLSRQKRPVILLGS